MSTFNQHAPWLWARTPWWLLETLPDCYTCQRLRERGELSEKGRNFEGNVTRTPQWSPFSHPAWPHARLSSGLRLVPPLQRAQRRTLDTVHVNTDSHPQAIIRSKSIDSSAITSFCIECLFLRQRALVQPLTIRVKISPCALWQTAHLLDVYLRWFRALCTKVYYKGEAFIASTGGTSRFLWVNNSTIIPCLLSSHFASMVLVNNQWQQSEVALFTHESMAKMLLSIPKPKQVIKNLVSPPKAWLK